MKAPSNFIAREQALGLSSAMVGAVLAGVAEQLAETPALLAELQAALSGGTANLGIFIRRERGTVYLSAGALPAGDESDPFANHRLIAAKGPAVKSLTEFASLTIIDPAHIQ